MFSPLRISTACFNLAFALLLHVASVGALATSPPVTKKLPALPVLDYLRDIRPILSAQCFTCHGQDEKKRQVGLRLDISAGAYGQSAEGHIAIVPGKPFASEVYKRITATSGVKMPPQASGKRLSPAEVATLKRWIVEGAKYAEHWAFLKPKRSPIPSVTAKKWVRNPIDNFILSRLEKEGLTPAPEGDRYTLIRRVSLDLIGLPPSPKEVDDFVADRSPDAYAKLVDRLLVSPHFGEKWARMWLDLARYADSAGYGSDPLRPNLWPYRDYVINAFNKNSPYNQFVTEQAAGDLLPNPSPEQLIATAFHRNTMTNTEGGTDREEFRTAAVKDRAITTAQVFMGLTMGCAQCHSHKFDPITNKEFYRFMAFFNQTEDNDQPNESPTMPLISEIQKERMATLKTSISTLETKAGTSPEAKVELEKQKKELADIKPVSLPIMRELPKEKLRQSHVLVLGNFLLKSEAVEPGTPAAFLKMPADAPMNRLGVAEWLVSRDNPLTARVAVNRFWAQIFGTGIVETEEDFGQQGTLPTHPELLDWLAVEFMDRGWNVKNLLKMIVTSAVYRQSSHTNAAVVERDPRNRLFARFPRRRLSAEGVRDQALALSGLLSEKIGGPSVYPPQPDGLWQAAFNGQRTYPTSTGEDRYRRGIYTFWRRTSPNPSMTTFDAPSREICTIRRIPTNTPLQALVTLNDPAYLEMAQAMGRRIFAEGGSDANSRIRYGLRLTLCRPPTQAQIQTLATLYSATLDRYRKDPEDAKKLSATATNPLPAGADTTEMAAWTVVSNVLLNLDSALTNH